MDHPNRFSHQNNSGPDPVPIKVHGHWLLIFTGGKIRSTASMEYAVLQRTIFLLSLGQDLSTRLLRWSILKLKCQRLILTEVTNCPVQRCFQSNYRNAAVPADLLLSSKGTGPGPICMHNCSVIIALIEPGAIWTAGGHLLPGPVKAFPISQSFLVYPPSLCT